METIKFIKTLNKFKIHMTNPNMPNYVKRYCEDLSGEKWEWFYSQMKQALEVSRDADRLFYVLKWILKQDFDDLTYAIYLQDYLDPEMSPEPLIKDEWQAVLHERYKKRLFEDICPDGGCA
jgi:hypothetical protein